MGGCQNYGPFLGPYINTAPILLGTKSTHVFWVWGFRGFSLGIWGLGFRVLGLGGLV